MPLRILYLAVGPDHALHTQALYAALSALAWRQDDAQSILLFTDTPHAYRRIANHVELLELPAKLSTLYVHPTFDPFQLKLALLEHVARTVADDAILFCDADTFFLQSYAELAAQLADGRPFLHRREYAIRTHPTGQTRRFHKALRRARLDDGTTELSMWNSGVVGLPPHSEAALQDAMSIFKKLSPYTRKRYLAEQFSITLALSRAATLTAAEPWVFHYWYQKQDYLRAIQKFLADCDALPLEELLHKLREQRFVLPAPSQKLHWWERALIRAGLRRMPHDIRGLPQ
jgi:hypothetical protein